MKLFTYIVARDYGFAPNPFYGYCTLATCKPQIRKSASICDWVIGTGAKMKYDLTGFLIYAMKIDEVMDFDSYWKDPRFRGKYPVMNGSLKQLYGDNIYHRVNGQWVQTNSHHSYNEGQPNQKNIDYDTGVNRLLIARKFVYYGNKALHVPERFRTFRQTGEDLCCKGRGYRVKNLELAHAFECWMIDRDEWGVQGMPLEFNYHNQIGYQG
jgi:hypothetical protein